MSRYSTLIAAQGANFHWALDETSGTTAVAGIGGIDLTINGAITLGVPAVVGTGFTSNGSTGRYLTASTTSVMAFISTSGFSYSWIMRADNTMTAAGAWGIVSRRTDSATGRTFGCFMNGSTGGTLNFDLGNNQARWDSGFIPVQGTYYHIAFVWIPGGTYQLYVNGVFQTSTTGLAPTTAGSTVPFWLFCLGAATPSQLFPGLIDEVAIWTGKSLSAAEIQAQYATAFPITRVFNGTTWTDADKKVL